MKNNCRFNAVKLLFILLLFMSCTKVEDFCWECTLIKTDLIEGTTYYDVFEKCNKTEEEILDMCNTHTYIVCYDASVLKCVKQ